VWNYFVLPQITSKVNRPVMKLVGLKSLCHLCHLGKHIGYAHSDSEAYQRVKQHLMELYRLPESIFSQLEQLAFEEVHELNKAGVRELDLTFLNDDKYVWIRHRFGRPFTENEVKNCKHLGGLADLGR
jgi:hypothetical protein